MEYLYLTGIVAATIILSATGHQIIKFFRTKDTTGFGYPLMICVFSGMILYTLFGIAINDPVVFYGNFIGVCMYVLMMLMKFTYERRRGVKGWIKFE